MVIEGCGSGRGGATTVNNGPDDDGHGGGVQRFGWRTREKEDGVWLRAWKRIWESKWKGLKRKWR